MKWLCLLVCTALLACGGDAPVAPTKEARAFLAAYRDPHTWEALSPDLVDGWPRRARDPRTGIAFVLVPAGEFTMGGRQPQEKPRHLVRISRPFYLGETEVTAAQWRRHVAEHGGDPAVPVGDVPDDQPATNLNWHDARRFCEIYGYRLPTEAEWEYACRGGEQDDEQAFWNDPEALNEHSWSGANARSEPRAVATRQPNALGLYDMLGSAWEWCSDRYEEGYDVADPEVATVDPHGPQGDGPRCLRGGSWMTLPPARPSDRGIDRPQQRNRFYGFRVLCPLPE